MPAWKYSINVSDVFHNDDLALAQKTSVIVNRIREASWYDEACNDYSLDACLEELEDAAEENDTQWWDEAWSGVYDIMDDMRVWVSTLV